MFPERCRVYQLVGAMSNGDRTFGILPHSQARDVQIRCLFLQASRVGDDQAGAGENRLLEGRGPTIDGLGNGIRLFRPDAVDGRQVTVLLDRSSGLQTGVL